MNNQHLIWIAIAVVVLLISTLAILAVRYRRPSSRPLPLTWALTARAVFSSDERRVYRVLREALPHHVILSKLPLVRFCEPTDPNKLRYWYELLGNNHVTFAVCSANGRVLAAIDLEAERGQSGRTLKIKHAVLETCRVRHMVCRADRLPSVDELRMLVPQNGSPSRAPQAQATLDEARDSLASTVANKRAERSALWQDSSLFQDSFFAMDARRDTYQNGDFSTSSDRVDQAAPTGKNPARYLAEVAKLGSADFGGIVTDSARS